MSKHIYLKVILLQKRILAIYQIQCSNINKNNDDFVSFLFALIHCSVLQLFSETSLMGKLENLKS